VTDTLPPGWRAVTCPRCGGPFECGVGADRATPCWCVDLQLDDARRADLRGRFADCLCAPCQRALAADPSLR
jgi:hypothetical protein